MPLELEWWDRQAIRAAVFENGSLFACEHYLDTDFGGLTRVDRRPAGEDPAYLPCEDF